MKTAAGRVLAGVGALAGASTLAAAAAAAITLALAPAAQAAIAPTLSLNQSAGTQAGSQVSLGTDLKFNPGAGDSPKDLTLSLPPGLLSNASIDGGACLASATPISACRVGSGWLTATGLGLVPVTLPVSFDLVAPATNNDLAGLQLLVDGSSLGLPATTPLGSPGEVTVRPASSPQGVGLDIAFTNMPDSLPGLPLLKMYVDELNSTLTGMRMPTSCPSALAQVIVTADSYNDATVRTAAAPLTDTGCSSLPFSPGFVVSAVRDAADSGVHVTTDVIQPASPPQATSRTVVLTLPGSVLAPNVLAVLNGGILCTSSDLTSCNPIGTASSTSPLYPKTLNGTAYLTGSLLSPGITLTFPPPFALTLTGSVDVASGSTTFQGLPDIPLTDLKVQLTGGPDSAFVATCNPAAGVASSTLTTQAGDRTLTVSDPFTVSGCPAVQSGGGSTGGGGGSGGGGTPHHPHPGRPRILWANIAHVLHGSPVLRLRAVSGRSAPKLRALTIGLPRGLRFLTHRGAVRVRLRGARVAAVRVGQGLIVILLRHPVPGVTVQVLGLVETDAFSDAAERHRLRRPRIGVELIDASGLPTVVHLLVRVLRF